jgi:alginate O-acetyltransferase complex protein AlgI
VPFTSLLFILVALPVVIIIDRILKPTIANIFLAVFSLFFYAWADLKSIPLFLAVIAINYLVALLTSKLIPNHKKMASFATFIGVAANIGVLVYFKYLKWIYAEFSGRLGITLPFSGHVNNIVAAVAVSFFTFHAVSFLLDVNWGIVKAPKNPLTVLIYIALFPKMIQGPIMRYDDFHKNMINRSVSLDDIQAGASRFIIGLSKKLIIATPFGVHADRIYAIANNTDSMITGGAPVAMAWLGTFFYCMQLFFDFSGYSDMAIGIGQMLGIKIPQNFNYPYISKRVAEFWRRWHMSLGEWFKVYLYTPLFRIFLKQSNNGKKIPIFWIDVFALLVLWVMVGFWHGAGLKYLVCGLAWFSLIAGERFFDMYEKKRRKKLKLPQKKAEKLHQKILGHIYLIVAVLLIQVIFRANTLADAGNYLKCMFGLNGAGFTSQYTKMMFGDMAILSLIAIALSTPLLAFLYEMVKKIKPLHGIITVTQPFILAGMLLIDISITSTVVVNPFLYQQF